VRRADGGGAGLLTVWASAAVLAISITALSWGGALVARHRADRAADIAALGGAATLQAGGDGCAAAIRLARAQGAQATSCQVIDATTVLVEVAVNVVGPAARWGRLPPARARARAGPALTGVRQLAPGSWLGRTATLPTVVARVSAGFGCGRRARLGTRLRGRSWRGSVPALDKAAGSPAGPLPSLVS
jgi:secretion/DNA translocation related TadE-like protein